MAKEVDKVVEYIVCPIDKAALIDKKNLWECTKCGAKFKVNEGIPNLIIDDAELPVNKS